MRFATVCSGIDAPALAWNPLGWHQVFSSEIDRFPSEVLAHHHPGVPNLGDMTKIKGKDHAGTIDVLCGGTPCQDFSIAGQRAGMDGDRGNLTLAFVELVGQIRPKWVVWENVPGVLSSNQGRDFGRFLFEMAELGYIGAWASLDAQYFNLAQRRKRVFAVFNLGNWQRAAAVLLEPESMSWNPAPSREAAEDPAGTLDAGIGRRRGSGMNPNQIAPALTSNPYGDHESREGLLVPSISRPLTAHANRSDLETEHPQLGDPCHPLCSGAHPPAVAVIHGTQDPDVSEIGHPLGRNSGQENVLIMPSMAVRRLTPRECERLQGCPDDFTLIRRANGKMAKDGPRYEALGNSMAVPVMRYLGERIQMVEKTKASV